MTFTSSLEDEESRAQHHEFRAKELSLVRHKITQNRDARLRIATDIMLRSKNGRLEPDDYLTFRKAIEDAHKYDGHLETICRSEDRHRERSTVQSVKAEDRTYRRGGDHSYFVDVAARSHAASGASGRAATQRLSRYEQELDVEMRSTSAEGLRTRQVVNEGLRSPVPSESRAMTTASGSGGSFVTPQYIIDNVWVPYRSPHRTFVDQCRAATLPDSGLKISIPAFTGPSGVSTVAENTATTETDPTGQYITANLECLTGEITVSLQLFERGGTDVTSFDEIAGAQLKEQLDAAIDAYVLSQVLASAATVTNAGAFSVGGLYTDLSAARAKLSGTAGTRLRGTHLITSGDFFDHVSSQLDSSNRPLMAPHFASQPWSGLTAAGDPKAEGWTGHIMPGGIAWFVDDNIPANGSDTQILVSRPETVLVFEGQPVVYAYPDANADASAMSVIVGIKAYVGVIPRWAFGTAAISGAAYPLTLV